MKEGSFIPPFRGNRYVETYSEGNEPYRHVVVKLKNR